MSLLSTYLLILCIGIASAKLPELPKVTDCGKSLVSRPRIVGGKTARFGDYPWIVSIQEKNDENHYDHICGGSVLDEHWIVTAAHCFNTSIDLVSNYKAYVGVRSILHMNEATVKKHALSKVIIHEGYNDNGTADDIALLKTTLPIDIKGSKGYVNAICLPKGVTNPSGNAKVIGWGLTKFNGSMINLLQEAEVPIVAWPTCKKIYGDKDSEFEEVLITPAMMCAGGNGKDTCQADSGGPLFQTDSKGVATLIGTVANGAECAYKHYPGVYMKVSAYTGWMRRKMT